MTLCVVWEARHRRLPTCSDLSALDTTWPQCLWLFHLACRSVAGVPLLLGLSRLFRNMPQRISSTTGLGARTPRRSAPFCRHNCDYRRPTGEKRAQHHDYRCYLGAKTCQVLAGPATSLCSTHDLEVFPWWYDLAVKIFPVLLFNSNRLVKKISDSNTSRHLCFQLRICYLFCAHFTKR